MLHYSIYQLPVSHKNCFMSIDIMKVKRSSVSINDYVHVYEGILDADEIDNEVLERIFMILNNDYPSDYYARSLSVSDIIELNDGNNARYFYVNSMGFEEFTRDELERSNNGK